MKNLDELLWETFKKSGQAGYYMLYKALSDDNHEEK